MRPALLLLAACGSVDPVIDELEQIIPGDGLPAEVVPQESNNNLDVIEHGGRFFLAFRTAPSHFASEDTHLYIMSSADADTWEHEATIAMGTDLREPRFLSVNGHLVMYFAVLGDNLLDFEPQGTMITERAADGTWSEPEEHYVDGFIPWRSRVLDGKAYITGYVGGAEIYEQGGEPLRVHFLTTTDGRDWTPVADDAVVLEGGTSETDFAFTEDGALIAVSRNEAGDEDGFGSKICRAEADDLGTWTCNPDLKKYDSPLVWADDGRIWLIGRRNVTDTGNYDLQRDDLDPEQRSTNYQWDYWHTPKRCSLWSVDPDELTVELVLDLPSKGDTCFASILDEGDGIYRVYNYSSPVDGPDVSWLDGQTGLTYIYRMRLTVR